MTAKEYLSQALYLKSKIKRCDEQIEEIHARMESAGAIRYDKPSIQSSPTFDALANYMIQLERAERKSKELRAIYYSTYVLIQEQIGSVQPALYSEILEQRWLDGRDLRTISKFLGYSYDRIKHLHGLALKTFDRIFLKDSTQ